MAKAVAAAAVATAAAVAGIGAAAIRTGGDFDGSMRTIETRSGMAADEVRRLESSIRDMALDPQNNPLRLTANEIAAAMANVTVAGRSAEHQIELVSQANILAAASGGQFEQVLGLLDLALVKTNSSVDYAEKYANSFAETMRLSGMAVSSLEKAVIAIAPTMNASGDSMEFVNGTLARLYQGGIRGTQAARGLEQIFNSMVSPTDSARMAMERLGVSMFDSRGNVRQMSDVLPELMDALDGVSNEQERLNLQNDLFSTVYSRAVITELSNNRDAWLSNVEAIYAAGSAMEAATANTGGAAAGMRDFKIAGQDMLLTIFSIIEQPFADTISRAAESVRDLALRMREGGDLHPVVQRLGEAISSLASIVVNLATGAIPVVLNVLTPLAGALSATLNMVEPLAPAIVGAVAAFYAWKVGLAASKIAMTAWNAVLTWSIGGMGSWGMVTGAATVKVGLLTKAKLALNKAFMANPVGAVLGGIALLTGGIVALSRHLNQVPPELEAVRRENELLRESTDALRDSVQRSAEAFDTRKRNIEAESVLASRFADRIRELTEAEGDSAEQRAELLKYTNLLVAAMPELARYIDEETGLLRLSNAEIATNIERRQEQARAVAAQERMIEIAREQINLEEKLNALEAEREQLFEKRRAAARKLGLELDELGNIISETSGLQIGPLLNEADRERLSAIQNGIRELGGEADMLAQSMDFTSRIVSAGFLEMAQAANTTSRATEETGHTIAVESRRIAQEQIAMARVAEESSRQQIYSFDQISASVDRFSRAQSEMQNQGSLSIRTVKDMVAGSNALALQINAETGAVELNTEAYIQMTRARMDEKIAALALDRSAMVEQLRQEAWEAANAAGATNELTHATIEANIARNADIVGMDATIAALQTMRDTLGQNATEQNNATEAASRRAERERQAEEQRRKMEQERLEAFRNEMGEIRELSDLRLLSIEDEIARLADLRDTYGNNAEKLQQIREAERDAHVRIADAHQETLDRMMEAEERFEQAVNRRAEILMNSALRAAEIDKLLKESAEDRANAVLEAEERVARAQARIIDITTSGNEMSASQMQEIMRLQEEIIKGQEEVTEARARAEKTHAQLIAEALEAQIENMREHARMMEHLLNETDITREFLEQLGLLESGAVNELRALYDSTEEELSVIADLFGEMQALATEQATHELQNMRYEVDEEIRQLYEEMRQLISGESPAVGSDMIQGMIDGALNRTEDLGRAITDIMNAGIRAGRRALDMRSPSRKFAEMADGSVDGFIQQLALRTSDVTSAL